MQRSAAEERQEQRQDNADDDAGDDREIKRGVAAFDTNVAGKTPQPAGAEAGPKRDADNHYDAAKNRHHSTELAHERR